MAPVAAAPAPPRDALENDCSLGPHGIMITREAYERVGGFQDLDQCEDLRLGFDVAIQYPFGMYLVPNVTVEVSSRRVRKGLDLDYRNAHRKGQVIRV